MIVLRSRFSIAFRVLVIICFLSVSLAPTVVSGGPLSFCRDQFERLSDHVFRKGSHRRKQIPHFYQAESADGTRVSGQFRNTDPEGTWNARTPDGTTASMKFVSGAPSSSRQYRPDGKIMAEIHSFRPQHILGGGPVDITYYNYNGEGLLTGKSRRQYDTHTDKLVRERTYDANDKLLRDTSYDSNGKVTSDKKY